MKKSFVWIVLVAAFLFVVFGADVAWAAPGGKIASTLFKTTWGKILGCLLVIVFLPLIIWVTIKEHFAEKRVLKELRRLAAMNRIFDWMTIRDRVTDCYHRVNAAWQATDMSEASEWMTPWYWQNQQLAFLNQWERDGLVNHCRIKVLLATGGVARILMHLDVAGIQKPQLAFGLARQYGQQLFP